MKDNISIIFTTIIGVFLIVILPLFSILDRQDSMSYNVVLTETTKFVDNIRNNGFIDEASYNNYIGALASTGNTYKVGLEVYKRRLMQDLEEDHVYTEDFELFNTLDVLEVIEGEHSVDNAESSNKKNNVYLLNQNDEVYIKVYNTNITSGSIIYKAFVNAETNKVINIGYGGAVNNINWELYNQVSDNAVEFPEVLMAVPVNKENKININKVTEDGLLEELDCEVYYEVCNDRYISTKSDKYTYLYDLSKVEDTSITIAVELKNVDILNVGDGIRLEDMTNAKFNQYKQEIISNFIQLNEITATNIDLKYRGKEEYYAFDIILSGITISYYRMFSVMGSVSILPGLGQDVNGTQSLGAETVLMEFVDIPEEHSVQISGPYNWTKLKETKNFNESLITNKEVYVNGYSWSRYTKGQEIAFVIEYTKVDEEINEVKNKIKNNLEIKSNGYDTASLEFFTPSELKNTHNINIATNYGGKILVKFKHNQKNESLTNYISLKSGWTKILPDSDIYIPEEQKEEYEAKRTNALGAESDRYKVLVDDVGPKAPTIEIEGIQGNNGWYKERPVKLLVIESDIDYIKKNNVKEIGGSGVQKTALNLTGRISTTTTDKEYTITEDLIYAKATTCDYIDNCTDSEQKTIKLDMTKPTPGKVTISGTKGQGNWYTPGTQSYVYLYIYKGKDEISGFDYATYSISGAENKAETKINNYNYYYNGNYSNRLSLTKEGENKVTITTYDKAGNSVTEEYTVYIEKAFKSETNAVTLQAIDLVTKDSITSNSNGWYNQDIGIRVDFSQDFDPASGIARREYVVKQGNSVSATVQIIQNAQIIPVQSNGKYTIEVYTYTNAGNKIIDSIDINIDKDKPNQPSITVEREPNSEGWYKSNAFTTTLRRPNDVGPSGIKNTYYNINTNGNVGSNIPIYGSVTRDSWKDGIHIITLTSTDYAGNSNSATKEIKIDVTKPISPNFVISGTQNEKLSSDDKSNINFKNKYTYNSNSWLEPTHWYTSDVIISHDNTASDATSGVKSVTLSHSKITEDTKYDSPIEVVMTTEDYAGNITKKATAIYKDSTKPTSPTINISTESTGQDTITGLKLYNDKVRYSITQGTDINRHSTSTKVYKQNNNGEYVQTSTSYNLSSNGKYRIETKTIDRAGNESDTVSTEIWINTTIPSAPNISIINDIKPNNSGWYPTVTGNTNKIDLAFSNLEIGNELTIDIRKDTTKQYKFVVTNKNQVVPITLEEDIGTYTITVKQKNMFGTTSSSKQYKYIYEE